MVLMEAKKLSVQPPKPPVKNKFYTSPLAPPTPSGSDAVKQPNLKKGNGVYVSPTYVAPAPKLCRACNNGHTHVFYCEKYSEADILTDCVKIVQKCQACFHCCRMNSEIDFKNRAQWEARHEPLCQSEFVCMVDECAKRATHRHYHFTLCKWHGDENKKLQPDFIKKLDLAQTKPGTSFFLNFPIFLQCESSHLPVRIFS